MVIAVSRRLLLGPLLSSALLLIIIMEFSIM